MKERPPKRLYEFDSFRIDVEERQLLRDGEPVAITPKVFDILLTLVENNGHTVPKEELIDHVWGDTFVYEGNLNRNVSTLRKAIGDDSHHPRFITTIPRRGYRFDGRVREVLQEDELLLVEKRTNYRVAIKESGRTETSNSPSAHRLVLMSIAAVGAIGLAAAAWSLLAPSQGQPLQTALAGNDRRFEGRNPEAVDLYKKGRQLWETRAVEDLHHATLILEKAVEQDPEFALAHAALADAYAFDFVNWRRAESIANDAIRLDPTLAQPHATIGFLKTFWEWDPANAEPYFKRAISLDPGYAPARQWFAISLTVRQREGLGLAEMKRAAELEPNSAVINADLCQILYFSRKYDLALEQCRKAVAMAPELIAARNHLYDLLTVRGMYDEAVEEYIRLAELSTLPASQMDKLRKAYENGGIRSFWRERINMLKLGTDDEYLIARYYALLGEKDKAIKRLSEARHIRGFNFLFVAVDPAFEDLYGDARFSEFSAIFVGPHLRRPAS